MKEYTVRMDHRAVRRTADDTRRYRLHNETLTPDVGLAADEYINAPRGVRLAITFGIVAIIMAIPVVAIVLALLK
jgi:hypothetical protein